MTYDRMTLLTGRSAAAVAKETSHRTVQTVGTFWALDDDEHDVHFRAAHDIVHEADVPAHKHTFEQVYFHLGGQQLMGGRVRPPGTIAYHPESVNYGPAEKGGDEPLEMVVCQFPAPSGKMFGSNEEVRRAVNALREEGAKIERGILVHPDGTRQDSTEAAFEWLMGGDIDYAPPRYDEPVVVHSPAAPWRPSSVAGVHVKHLGYFNERGPNVLMLKLDPDATTEPGISPCAQMRFVYEGSLEVSGETAGRVSALYYPPNCPYDGLTAGPDGAEVFVIQLQQNPDGPPPAYESF